MKQTQHDSETPAHGQQVITAVAFLHHDFDGVKKVFLPRRANTKKFLPGVFELPGGHINFGEDIVDGLQREIREEFGVDCAVGDPFAAFTYTNHVKGSHSIEVAFFAQFTQPLEKITLDPADHSEHRWFAQDEYAKFVVGRQPDDPETNVINKGFSLLAGEAPKFK